MADNLNISPDMIDNIVDMLKNNGIDKKSPTKDNSDKSNSSNDSNSFNSNNSTSSSIDFDIKYDHALVKKGTKKERKVGPNELRGNNYRKFLEYLDSIKPNGEIIKSILNNKSVCISINYERSHLNEMKKITQLLKNHGAEYNFKASESDIFVKYDVYDAAGNLKTCIRLKHVNEAIENGKSIKIISFDELLSIIGISIKELANVSSLEENSCSETNQKKTEPRNNKTKRNSIISSFGDFIISSGINIEDFYDDK